MPDTGPCSLKVNSEVSELAAKVRALQLESKLAQLRSPNAKPALLHTLYDRIITRIQTDCYKDFVCVASNALVRRYALICGEAGRSSRDSRGAGGVAGGAGDHVGAA